MTTTTSRSARGSDHGQRRTSAVRWTAFIAAPLILATLVGVSVLTESDPSGPSEAPPFDLPTSDGRNLSLDQALTGGDVLLYFSMGVGCDGCFAQIPELEEALVERGLTLVPIMVDSAPSVAAEAARFGIDHPILIDSGARISSAYGMVGIYGHGDRPSHSFALVRQNGDIAWTRHYAEMFVPAQALLGVLDAALRG